MQIGHGVWQHEQARGCALAGKHCLKTGSKNSGDGGKRALARVSCRYHQCVKYRSEKMHVDG